MEEEKVFMEYLKKVSPGTALRMVIDDLIRSELGALIVFEAPEIEKCFEGGFRLNCRFSPERLFFLCFLKLFFLKLLHVFVLFVKAIIISTITIITTSNMII